MLASKRPSVCAQYYKLWERIGPSWSLLLGGFGQRPVKHPFRGLLLPKLAEGQACEGAINPLEVDGVEAFSFCSLALLEAGASSVEAASSPPKQIECPSSAWNVGLPSRLEVLTETALETIAIVVAKSILAACQQSLDQRVLSRHELDQ